MGKLGGIRLWGWVLVFLGCSASAVEAQDLFANSYGGTGTEWAYSLQQTPDGGYILSGPSSTSSAGSYDFWIVKLDAAGAVVWQKTLGGSADDIPNGMLQTADGGYLLAGRTSSYGAGGLDLWVVKLDSSGNVVWQKSYGGSGSYDAAYSVRQAPDGGYYLAGWTNSFGTGYEMWLLKLDSSGNSVWQKAYGGSGSEFAYSSCLSGDGGLVVAGSTSTGGAGSNDFWVIKVDSSGNRVWQKAYGGSGADTAFSVETTADGGYVVAGRTESFGAGSADFWVLKLDSTGNILWQRTYGGTALDWAFAVRQTADGGYLVAGQTLSFGAAKEDVWILRLDSTGGILWQRAYGGSELDYAYCVGQASDGSLLVGGVSGSSSAGSYDAVVLKLADSCLAGNSCSRFRTTAGTTSTPSCTTTTTTRNPTTSTAASVTTTAAVTSAPVTRTVQCAYPTLPRDAAVTLTLSKSGNSPRLSWAAPPGGCSVTGYGVYRGTFPIFPYNYQALDCAVPDSYFVDSTAGENQYYILVPNNAYLEGSFGTSFDGTKSAERPAAPSPCRPQCLLPCP